MKWWIRSSRIYPGYWVAEFPYWGSGNGFMALRPTFEEARLLVIEKIKECLGNDRHGKVV